MLPTHIMIDWPSSRIRWRNRSELFRLILINIGVFIGYVAFAALSTRFVTRLPSYSNVIAPVWLSTGFAAFAILRIGKRSLPGMFFGSLFANSNPWFGPMLPLLGIWVSFGNVFALLVARILFQRLRPAGWRFTALRDVLLFIGIIGVLGSLVSGLWGALGTALGSFQVSLFFKNWIVWALCDVASVLEVTPLLLLWGHYLGKSFLPKPAGPWRWWVVALGLFSLTAVVYCVPYPRGDQVQIFSGLLILPFLWALTRFSLEKVYLVNVLSFLMASLGTDWGLGPFQGSRVVSPETITQFTMMGLAVALLVSHAMLAENQQAKTELQEAVTTLDKRVRERTTELNLSNAALVTREAFFRSLSEVNRLLAESVDRELAEVLPLFCNILQDNLHLQAIWIGKVAPGEQTIEVLASAGVSYELWSTIQMTIDPTAPEGRCPSATAIRSGLAQLTNTHDDCFDPWRSMIDTYQLGDCASVPFEYPDLGKGVITLCRAQGDPITESIFMLLSRVVEDLAAYLQRRATHVALGIVRKLQQSLMLAGDIALTTQDITSLLQKSCQQLIDSGLFVAAWIVLPDEKGIYLKSLAMAGKSADHATTIGWPMDARVIDGTSVAARAWRSGSVQVQQNYFNDPLVASWRERAREYGYRSIAAVPIWHQQQQWALLVVISDQVDMFSAEVLNLIQQVALLVGHGLDERRNAENLLYISRENDQLLQYQAAAVQFQQELLALVTPQSMYTRLVEIITTQTATLGAFLGIPDAAHEWLRVVAAAAKDDEGLQQAMWNHTPSLIPNQFPYGELIASRAFRDTMTQGPEDPAQSAAMHAVMQEIPSFSRIHSAMAFPILLENDNDATAVLVILSDHSSHFTLPLQRLLGQLAVSLGLALTQLRHQRELVEAEEKVHHMAFYDPLTRLPNRRMLEDRMEQTAARADRYDRLFAVCMLDLDNFKPINDTYGHEMGDIVLMTIGKRLLDVLRPDDSIARLGGDEFVIVIDDLASWQSFVFEALRSILDRITQSIITPIDLPTGDIVQVGVSMGVCLVDATRITHTPDQWLRDADQALYESKRHKADRQRVWVLADPIS